MYLDYVIIKAKPARKQNLTRNNDSRSFKVNAFWDHWKVTTDCISLYNNARITFKVSKNSQRKRWKLPFSTTPLSFDAPSPGNVCEYFYKPCPTFLPLIVWVYLHSVFLWYGLRKTHLFCNRVRIGRSRSSKVVDFSTSRKAAYNFLLVINSNFGPVMHRFWDTTTYWLKIANFSYPTRWADRQTDRQTDTTYHQPTNNQPARQSDSTQLKVGNLTPSLGVIPFEFLDELFCPENYSPWATESKRRKLGSQNVHRRI